MRTSLVLACALCTPLIHATQNCSVGSDYKEYTFAAEDILERDVVIIGGGATGTYAGVRLVDQGKSIAIVELSDKLGGHVNTLSDPVSRRPIDYGVQAYINNEQTINFFSRFNVSLINVSQTAFPSTIVDFNTGFIVPNATAVNPLDLVNPLSSYLSATANFPGLAEGAYDLPSPVPEDLYLPFGAFVAKYNLTEVLQVAWIFSHGVGNLLEKPTLYVLQNFGQPQLLGLNRGYLAPAAAGGNQEVYNKAAALLGNSVLYSSKVVQTTRGDGVSVVVRTPTGHKLIKAKKLLVTIPPTIDNLSGFDISAAETKLFSQWNNVPYYVGVLNNTGLPDLTNFYNVDLTRATFLPQDKFVFRIETVGVSGYQTVQVIGESDSVKAQKLVTDAVARIGLNYGINATAEFAAWEEHSNLQLNVAPDSIAGGFYADLYALQGQRSTYWTGNAWASDNSPLLWAFTEKRILPSL
jgi:hypothetical protein